jgi:arginine exporter protein ArgO
MILNPETQICANCLWFNALCYTARELALVFRNHAIIKYTGVINVVLDDAQKQ